MQKIQKQDADAHIGTAEHDLGSELVVETAVDGGTTRSLANHNCCVNKELQIVLITYIISRVLQCTL